MAMTFDEMKQLLAFCAVFDKRKGDRFDVKAWLLIAEDHRWTGPLTLRVAREHYGAGANRPRLEPPAITDRIRQMRSRAADSFEAPRIPDGLPDADYPAWYRAQLAEHIDTALDRWAHTGDEPPAALPPAPPVVRTARELGAATPASHRPVVVRGLRRLYDRTIRVGDQRREKTAASRAGARAELDQIRPLAEDAS